MHPETEKMAYFHGLLRVWTSTWIVFRLCQKERVNDVSINEKKAVQVGCKGLEIYSFVLHFG